MDPKRIGSLVTYLDSNKNSNNLEKRTKSVQIAKKRQILNQNQKNVLAAAKTNNIKHIVSKGKSYARSDP